MGKDKVSAPTASVTFDITAIPYSLGMVAQLSGHRLNYFTGEGVAEPVYVSPQGNKVTGYVKIIQTIAGTELAEGLLPTLAMLVPLLYTGSAIVPPSTLSEVSAVLTDAAAEGHPTTGSPVLDYVIVGSPLVSFYMGNLPQGAANAVVALCRHYEGDKNVRSGRGQVSVALKKFEREALPQTGPRLENAEMGKVCTRFPPEPSGYLHIGHAKAALLNAYFARIYKGRLHHRLDDTNPAKESDEFVANIKRDLATLGVKYDTFSHTSDHFELFLEKAEELIRRGLAYCDKTPADQMQKDRQEKVESPYRAAPLAENLRLWGEMQAGSEEGQGTCLRARIDMSCPNGCMRDPVIYRVNVKDAHHRTGFRYKVYPTYDFVCPIVDSIEGITHALRTTEFLDRNEQYYWFCDTLGLRKPIIQDFSRLRMQYSLMGKRHLQWFVDTGRVPTWFDPRFPTVQGLMRRGLKVEGLSAFILEQGASRKVNYQEWSKLWAVNKTFIEPVAKRFHAVYRDDPCIVTISDNTLSGVEMRDMPCHPKNTKLGTKQVAYSSTILLDASDLASLTKAGVTTGSRITLMGWGNFEFTCCVYERKRLSLQPRLEDTDYATTQKLTWLGLPEGCGYDGLDASLTRVQLVYYGHLVTKAILGPEDNFRDYVNPDSIRTFDAYVQKNFGDYVKAGDIVQLERWGFYYVDRVEDNGTYVLHYVPEGKKNAQVGAFTFDLE